MSSPAEPGLWEPRFIPADRALHCQFGPLTVWMDYRNDELRTATSRENREAHDCFIREEVRPDSVAAAVERFAFQTDRPAIRAVPVLPDRSVIVRPESVLTLLPGENALFFISLPLWIRFERTEPEGLKLITVPSVILSNTWYGDSASGELCYAVKSRARRRLEDLEKRSWRVICPINVHNRDEEALTIVRLCVQVRHLEIFQGRDHLWTNQVDILNSESGQPLRLTYSSSPPGREPIIRSLSPPQVPVSESFIHRGLSSLRLPGF